MNENQKKVTDRYRDSYDKIFGKAQPTAVEERAAVGTKGFIMRSADGSHFFRVYNDGGEFIDYDIMHYDMEVQILEDSAVFINKGENNYIDYSAKVLGYVDE
jgi:hypothetical protein